MFVGKVNNDLESGERVDTFKRALRVEKTNKQRNETETRITCSVLEQGPKIQTVKRNANLI